MGTSQSVRPAHAWDTIVHMMKYDERVDRREDMSKIWRRGSVSEQSLSHQRHPINVISRCTAQVETQLTKTRDSKRTKSSDPKFSFFDPDVDTLFSSSFRPGATEHKIPRPADAPKSSRQSSMPEEQEYSSMPDVNDSPFTLPISSMSSNSRPLPQMVENTTSNTIPDQQMMENLDLGLDATFSWEMIGLGLEEPMPMQEAIDELYDMRAVSLSRTNTAVGPISTSTRYIHLCQCSIDIDIKHP